MNNIIINGITTHNLKDIDISIPKNKIIAIYGRSGAGKSSLAFSTLHQLCKDEFESLENGFYSESDYTIDSYIGLIPSVAIPQRNSNNNPRSTIYSYLNIPQALSSLKAKKNISIPDYNYLKINKYENECPICKGLGVIADVDESKLIDYECSLEQKPFSCWRTGQLSDYYQQLLIAFCKEKNIDTSLKFSSLPHEHQYLILNGESNNKLIFRCKTKGKTRQRRAFYKGVMLYTNNKIEQKSESIIYKTQKICMACHGSRINNSISEFDILSIKLKDFLLYPISKLCKTIEKQHPNSNLHKLLLSIVDMGLGYLSLSRSIPSLSGGELQKLIFSRLLTSNTTGILIVIDEISSQLNIVDYPKILEKIRTISKNNSIILVEHNQFFIDAADIRIHIGRFAGASGGVISPEETIRPLPNKNNRNIISDFFYFNQLSKNNILNQNVSIPKGCVSLFVGVSGSGKSSLAKAISEKSDSLYISQKTPNYTGRSFVATITNLNNLIAAQFSKKTGYNSDYFLPNKIGGCNTCHGQGVIKYERGFENDIHIKCPKCNGSLFDESLMEVNSKVKGMTIIDIYNSELKNIGTLFDDSSINRILSTLDDLGLSHLTLSRKTHTLSGGEMRRIKLCEILSKSRKTNKILIIDEPLAGLDPETGSKVLNHIYKKSHLFNAIILIEHHIEAESFADYKVSIGPFAGDDGGNILYQGKFDG